MQTHLYLVRLSSCFRIFCRISEKQNVPDIPRSATVHLVYGVGDSLLPDIFMRLIEKDILAFRSFFSSLSVSDVKFFYARQVDVRKGERYIIQVKNNEVL